MHLLVLCTRKIIMLALYCTIICRVQLKCDGTWWRTGGEVKGKLANWVGSQYSYATSEQDVSSITTADLHASAASSRLNWRPRWFKWTRLFCWKMKSGFCACAITFQMQSTYFAYIYIYMQIVKITGFVIVLTLNSINCSWASSHVKWFSGE